MSTEKDKQAPAADTEDAKRPEDTVVRDAPEPEGGEPTPGPTQRPADAADDAQAAEAAGADSADEDFDKIFADDSGGTDAQADADNAPPRGVKHRDSETNSAGESAGNSNGRGLALAAIVLTIITLIALAATIAIGAVYLLPAMQQGSERAGTLRTDIAETSRNISRVDERIAALDQRAAERATRLQADIDGAKRAMESDVDTVERAMERVTASMTQLRTEQTETLAELKAQSTQRDAAIQALNERVAGGQRGWQLNELEHLLLIGNERLQLANDLDGALAALQFADGRISTMNDPALTPTREAITADIAAIEATPRIDRQRIALRLGTLIDQVATLPMDRDVPSVFKPDANTASETEQAAAAAGARAWDSIKRAMAKTFTVRPAEAPAAPLLPPDQEYFLRQNLLLKVETARLAVLQGDAANFTEALRGARSWISEYFDPDDAAVQAALSLIDDVSSAQVTQDMPDISGSLAKLRAVMSERSR